MTEDDSQWDQKLVIVATAGNEAEADVIRQRLEAAAIAAITQRAIGGPEWGASGSRYVYVRAADEARARDILAVQDPSLEDPAGKHSGRAPAGSPDEHEAF
jgi:hypothetical protein